MGCLTREPAKRAWHRFGNIHLSGPCNRNCYFCIGQHMPALDPLNTLTTWPLPGMDQFIERIKYWDIKEINLTGSNTDPLLFQHIHKLRSLFSREHGYTLGIRTNGVLVKDDSVWRAFDQASVSVTSFDPEIYKQTMGHGHPPDLVAIHNISDHMWLSVNLTLLPENREPDLLNTITTLAKIGIKSINLREPYGQPHMGNPIVDKFPMFRMIDKIYGMPTYILPEYSETKIVYWDVHYVEVESVNLYASGRVSEDYSVTKGHSVDGTVIPQKQWARFGRQFNQWMKT